MNIDIKTIFIGAITFFGLAFFVYLLFAFGQAEINCLKWGEGARFFCAMLFAIVLFVSIGISQSIKPNK